MGLQEGYREPEGVQVVTRRIMKGDIERGGRRGNQILIHIGKMESLDEVLTFSVTLSHSAPRYWTNCRGC